MATWPDTPEALANIGNVHDDQEDIVTQCLAAAIEYLTYRCTITVVAEVPVVTDSVRRACLILTHRLFRRTQSPEGVASFGEFGAIRVTRIDPDIEAMLLPSPVLGHRLMVPLKTIRSELGALLAAQLDIAVAPLGANVNPPCVIVQPGDPYLEAVTYCADGVNLEALLIPRAGEGSAIVDALDDMVDQVRAALRENRSPTQNLKFAWSGVKQPRLLQITGVEHWGAVASIRIEREE